MPRRRPAASYCSPAPVSMARSGDAGPHGASGATVHPEYRAATPIEEGRLHQLRSAPRRDGGRVDSVGMGPNSNSATGGPFRTRGHAMTAGKILVESCATRSALEAEEWKLRRPGRWCRLPPEKLGRRAGCLIPAVGLPSAHHVPSSTRSMAGLLGFFTLSQHLALPDREAGFSSSSTRWHLYTLDHTGRDLVAHRPNGDSKLFCSMGAVPIATFQGRED
jgi:hypothetical protein